MKKIIVSFFLCMLFTLAKSQEYNIVSAGQANSSKFLVSITVSTKNNPKKEAEDLVKRYAVHGVMFRGVMSNDGYGEHKPIIRDVNVEQTKADFFNAFNKEGAYRRYVTITPSTLVIMKNKQTKMYETTAQLIVDAPALEAYLEESGITKGFSNLW